MEKKTIMENCKCVVKLDKYGPCVLAIQNIKNKFWSQVFEAYEQFFYKVEPKSEGEVLAEPICFNKHIKIGNKAITTTNWANHGVCKIGDFFKENGMFLSHNEFTEKYPLQLDFLTFTGCKRSILEYIKCRGYILSSNAHTLLSAPLKKLYSIHRGSKLYYDLLLNNTSMPNCCNKWEVKLNTNINWNMCFSKVKKIPDVTLKWFQVRILHRIIATNVILQEMGISADNKCCFCVREKDSIQHIFFGM